MGAISVVRELPTSFGAVMVAPNPGANEKHRAEK